MPVKVGCVGNPSNSWADGFDVDVLSTIITRELHFDRFFTHWFLFCVGELRAHHGAKLDDDLGNERGDLGYDRVAQGCYSVSVHPGGKPIIASMNSGQSGPPCCLAIVESDGFFGFL